MAYEGNQFSYYQNIQLDADGSLVVSVEGLTGATGSTKYVVSGDFNYPNGTLTLTQSDSSTVVINGLKDYFTTGGTFNNSTKTLTLTDNQGAQITITGFTDNFVTGGTFNNSTQTLTLNRNDGNSVSITGFTSGSLNYNQLTEIPGQMVWDAIPSSAANSRFKVGGGLMIGFPVSSFALVSGRVYANTIILEPGETLTEMMFNIPSFTTASTFNIGLFNLTSVELNNSISYRVGTLQKVIASGLTISSSGDKKITGINYIASAGTSPNNAYAICLFQNGGCSISSLSSGNLIPHIMGGELIEGTYYRTMISHINGVSSTSFVNDLSSNNIASQTSPGWYFVYKTK
jgi:hypothetical protein